jgi:hypothetical protein
MKTCVDCSTQKPYSGFHTRPSCKDGYDVRCTECRNLRYNKADPTRVFKKLYNSQITHSKTRGHPAPNYSFEELLAWVDLQPNTHSVWDAYVASGYKTKLKPSLDRLDDYQGYSLTNIQLTTWGENKAKYCAHAKAGINTKNCRPVSAYSLDGQLHQTFHSTIEASRQVGGNTSGIINVANGVPIKDSRGHMYQPRTYKGFIWKWV